MSNIAFATGSRADYGIVRRYLVLLNKDADIHLEILVTGALLDDRYGHQESLIIEDGFEIGAEVELPLDTRSNEKILHSMSVCMDQFASVFRNKKYDLLILLGDR